MNSSIIGASGDAAYRPAPTVYQVCPHCKRAVMSFIDINDFDESLCLRFNPFDGDFGNPTDRCLKDKIGLSRKQGPCSLCGHEIQPNEKIRMASHIFDGEMYCYRWCCACCAAMANSFIDDGEAYEKRIILSSKGQGK